MKLAFMLSFALKAITLSQAQSLPLPDELSPFRPTPISCSLNSNNFSFRPVWICTDVEDVFRFKLVKMKQRVREIVNDSPDQWQFTAERLATGDLTDLLLQLESLGFETYSA
jgi:hypothetical protein